MDIIRRLLKRIREMDKKRRAYLFVVLGIVFIMVWAFVSAGVITAGTATLKYDFRPASCAEEVAEVWESALNVKAV